MEIQLTKILLSEGRILNQETKSIQKIVDNVNNQRQWLHSQHIDDLLEFIDKLGQYWAKVFLKKLGLTQNI